MGRLIIVSNRLPFTVRVERNELVYTASTGGLVSGLGTFLESTERDLASVGEHIWVGWPGGNVEGAQRDIVRNYALKEFKAHPVFLSETDMDQFYHGFCNKTIWPLFHYFPSYVEYSEDFWRIYQRVNEIFCDAVAEIVQADDLVWIHDYHLMLLPHLLKVRLSANIPIGFFLHIPFPSFELFRLLPQQWRTGILNGLLGAQLIGFHTFEYAEHFLRSVLRILGSEHHLGVLTLPDQMVKVETYPMGIDFKKFHDAWSIPEVGNERKDLLAALGTVKVILSVDRLDYSKGILNRLEGFELLLQSYPEVRGKVVLLMVVVPSRIGVDQYEHMKRHVEELVGRINGEFGTVSWVPVIYQFRQVSFMSLAALYDVSDVALVTPLRDGMNLVAKEYVATRADATGVLILSEMAGAAKELGEAIIINPNDRREIAEGLRQALDMPLEEQTRRNQIMRDRLKRYDVVRWATEFVSQLKQMKEVERKFNAKIVSPPVERRIIDGYRRATQRLLLLDYDGTLAPIVRRPSLAGPSSSLLELLSALTRDPSNFVVVISGRDRQTLDRWLGGANVALVAEHGFWLREAGGDWRLLKEMNSAWKEHVRPILQFYADRLPGAHVEEKEFSLAWHYRMADPEQARQLAAELTDHIHGFTSNSDIQVLQGNKVVEVRNAGVNKGTAVQHWLQDRPFEFILCVGDDWTDEDMFAVVPEHAFSIRIGMTNTLARYNIKDLKGVLKLLSTLRESTTPVVPEGIRAV